MSNDTIFNNSDFINGFIDFYQSQDFEKYMVPFLNELIETHRDKLESTDEAKVIQGRIKAIRFIKGMGAMLTVRKKDLIADGRQSLTQQGESV